MMVKKVLSLLSVTLVLGLSACSAPAPEPITAEPETQKY